MLMSAVDVVRAEPRVAVAWSEGNGDSAVQAFDVQSPWSAVTPPLSVDPGPRLRFARGRLFALSPVAGTIKVIDPTSWTVEDTFSLGGSSFPVDIAVVSPTRAYVTRESATHLLRLDLVSGATSNVINFAPMADADGVPDLGTMIVDGNRLLVQVRRLNSEEPEFFLRPAYIAVIDLVTETLVDVEPTTPGMQGISLEGTAPTFKMQIGPRPRRLFVSAAYGTHTAGRVEMINLDTMQSLGIVAAEVDPPSGVCCDMAPFVMVSSSRGYFTFSTDSTLSSHLHFFTIGGGIDPTDLHTSLGYEAANHVHDPGTDHLFVPVLEDDPGFHIFDAGTGIRLSSSVIATPGLITDLELMCNCGEPGCGDLPECTTIPAASTWGLVTLALMLTIAGTVQLRRYPRRNWTTAAFGR